jgi:hypothetical protein
MPTSTRSETGDRVGSFLLPPERATYQQASHSIKNKPHLVMCCQQASCASSDYTKHVGRMRTTPQVINVCERSSTYEEISVHPRFPVWLPPQPPEPAVQGVGPPHSLPLGPPLRLATPARRSLLVHFSAADMCLQSFVTLTPVRRFTGPWSRELTQTGLFASYAGVRVSPILTS